MADCECCSVCSVNVCVSTRQRSVVGRLVGSVRFDFPPNQASGRRPPPQIKSRLLRFVLCCVVLLFNLACGPTWSMRSAAVSHDTCRYDMPLLFCRCSVSWGRGGSVGLGLGRRCGCVPRRDDRERHTHHHDHHHQAMLPSPNSPPHPTPPPPTPQTPTRTSGRGTSPRAPASPRPSPPPPAATATRA
jgi:hypothetical protein